MSIFGIIKSLWRFSPVNDDSLKLLWHDSVSFPPL